MARRAESARLGWRATAALSALRAADPANAQPTRELAVTLRDSTGAPVSSADVRVTLIHNFDAANPVQATLTESAPGVYSASLSLRARGRWEVRVDASRAESRFGAVLHAEAP
jgi:nitrogen fixation protein FixH